MINNDEDDAVPWYQGIEFFLALRRLNKEAYMFSYNGEKHGLRQRINQKDYTRAPAGILLITTSKGAPRLNGWQKAIPLFAEREEKEKYRGG